MSRSSAKTVKLPITNVFCGGDYTARILLGSEKDPANVVLDTGSSTLAVKEGAYQPGKDKNLKPTSICQDVVYGTAGWGGPVVQTSVALGGEGKTVTLNQTHLAVIEEQQTGNLGHADGILGLAYHSLNRGYDLRNFLEQLKISPPVTYPWPFQTPQGGFGQFQKFFLPKMQAQPERDITPYFSELERKGIVANKMAFYTLRSGVHAAGGGETVEAAIEDPLNQGFFVIGGGEGETELYEGSFKTVKALHDAYYNTNLKSIQVEGGDPIKAGPLQPRYQPLVFTNSFVDSGTNHLALAFDLHRALLNALARRNRRFSECISEFESSIARRQGLPMGKLDLEKWPDIHFVLEGEEGEEVQLTCTPQTYWQVNCPLPGQAFFKISGFGASAPNLSILGLPLMNNYYTIFDRSVDPKGAIKFAPIKRPAGV